ncbi:murein L,D-transpeptidase catalytic domain family protein [Cytophagaceae bacterium YF14B1]|uniref:Murein L,D-transpeptidase catalytic domain family protein n=1 Tax=Xanthocytophaga flava TaxID=3048013 RepID=A0AAE3QZW6_9BACT|nr:murein L,D-transpeptidase catalytic domain family protein [Xanthocytophaga flavus]MDJ1485784.1 murein L,D-transpeptidase catalytic domain family protein [Xanthocytophaga flavus]
MKKLFVLIAAVMGMNAYGQLLLPAYVQQHALQLSSEYKELSNRTIACVVDFSKPSYEKRLWIINLKTGECLLHTWVAHGKGTGRTAEASIFSNDSGSNCSSLGVFIPKNQFNGKHGLSLRLVGLDWGINDQAEARGIIFHAAPYVTSQNAQVNKRQGNSQGCFAVPTEDIKTVVKLLENTNAFIWAFKQLPSIPALALPQLTSQVTK